MTRRAMPYKSPGYRCKECDTPLHYDNNREGDDVCDLCIHEKATRVMPPNKFDGSWRSFDDGPPPLGQRVFLWVPDGEIVATGSCGDNPGDGHDTWRCRAGEHEGKLVTHWKPIPRPMEDKYIDLGFKLAFWIQRIDYFFKRKEHKWTLDI